MVENSPESEKYARDSHNDDEVYVVPAFTGLGAPYWNQNARGSVFGLTVEQAKKTLSRQLFNQLLIKYVILLTQCRWMLKQLFKY